MRLGSTTETLELLTGAAQSTDWQVSWVDIPASGASSAGQADGNVSLATTTPIVAAPGAGVHRQIQWVQVRNRGTSSQTITLKKDISGTERLMHQAVLAANESMEWTPNLGLVVTDALGRGKNVNANGSGTLVLARSAKYQIGKASLATQVAATPTSLWRATGIPAQGAIPTAAAVCDATTLGAMPLPSRTGGERRIIRKTDILQANANAMLVVEDRLAHMGGLSGTVTTAQSVNLDLSTLGSNMAQRIGAADYSECLWWLEWYITTGTTSVTPTINVTFHDGTTGTASIWLNGATAVPASMAASRRAPLISNAAGKFIRGVTNITHVTMGAAGNYGVTATRPLTEFTTIIASRTEERKFSLEDGPPVFDNSCVTLSQIAGTTSSGVVTGPIEFAVAA